MAGNSKGFNSFKDFFDNSDVKFEAPVETISRQDENMANNRLFVWNFESVDLEEMVDIFELYKRDTANEATRQRLNSGLLRKMNAMLREGYNPIECMLYASKVINQKLSNDKSIQDILAERIRDVYLKSELETSDILKNIMEMWTWVPQLKVVITAIGLIGENEELLDLVSMYYGEDENLKDRAFHAFMQNKSMSNLERVLKIITNLQNTEADQIMGRRFAKEVSGFGWEGIQIVERYNEHPAVTRTGKNVIRRILRANGTIVEENNDDEMYRETLATKSAKDDLAFKDFMEDCRERCDRRAAFLCRFSRAESGQFLKEMLDNSEAYDSQTVNDAIISMAIVGKKGYSPAAAIIKDCYREDDENYAPIVADVILGEQKAIKKLVDILCEKRDHELGRLYGILKTSNLKFYTGSMDELQRILYSKFSSLAEKQDYYSLDILASNLQILWDKKLYFIIPMELLKYMQAYLMEYSRGEHANLPESIVISIMNTIVYSWKDSVENVIFSLYHNADNPHIQQLSYKILQGREVQAPK